MSEADYAPGSLIEGKYQIIRTIGAGGMGTVYEVLHVGLEKRFALKTLQRKYVGETELISRFRNEAKIHAKLDGHKNIVGINDVGISPDGVPFYVMELLDRGTSLGTILRRTGRLEPRRAVEVAVDLFEALAYAHGKGIIHRDIKPDNIYIHTVGPFWFVKVVDFGIARILARPAGTGDRYVGTLGYSAREHLMGGPPTPKMDVYAATLVLFAMLTGRSAFAKFGKDLDLVRALMADPPPYAPVLTEFGDFSLNLTSLVARGLSHNPDERPDALYMGNHLYSIKQEFEGQAPITVDATIEDLSTTVHTLIGEVSEVSTKRPAAGLAATLLERGGTPRKSVRREDLPVATDKERRPRESDHTDVDTDFVPPLEHTAHLDEASESPRSWEAPRTPAPVDRAAATNLPSPAHRHASLPAPTPREPTPATKAPAVQFGPAALKPTNDTEPLPIAFMAMLQQRSAEAQKRNATVAVRAVRLRPLHAMLAAAALGTLFLLLFSRSFFSSSNVVAEPTPRASMQATVAPMQPSASAANAIPTSAASSVTPETAQTAAAPAPTQSSRAASPTSPPKVMTAASPTPSAKRAVSPPSTGENGDLVEWRKELSPAPSTTRPRKLPPSGL